MFTKSAAIFTVIFVIDLIIGIWYAKEGHPYVTKKAFALKMTASGIFVVNGIAAACLIGTTPYARLVITALILGMLGDALLSMEPFIKPGLNEKKTTVTCVVIGAASFLAGHVFYIIAFVKELKAKDAFDLKIFVLSWVALLAIAIAVKTALRVKLGKLALPMLVYALGLSAMGAMSICLALLGFGGHPFMQATLITAPLCFMISDSTLALKYADRKRFGLLSIRMVTLITYYAAQMLFGYTIILMQ